MRNYQLKIVLPQNVSIERKQLLEVWGAEIIPSPGELGSNGAVKLAQELAIQTQTGIPVPIWQRVKPQVHYETTGPEILNDVPEITHFVAGLGTSGTPWVWGGSCGNEKERHTNLAVNRHPEKQFRG